jgi:hypothetical protein
MWRRVTFIPIEERFLLSQHTSSKFFQNPLLSPSSVLHLAGRLTSGDQISEQTFALLDYSNNPSRWLPIVIDDGLCGSERAQERERESRKKVQERERAQEREIEHKR